jgi:hypothetical protein
MQIVYFRSSQQNGNSQDEGLTPPLSWRPKSNEKSYDCKGGDICSWRKRIHSAFSNQFRHYAQITAMREPVGAVLEHHTLADLEMSLMLLDD